VLYFGLRAYRIFTARFRAEQRRAEQLAELHLATIEALARAIDAKDGTAENHIRRVQLFAAAVARELGMSDAETQAVRTAALLHDIGKLAVPEHILSKPGPLTAEEFQKVQAHPQVGADIIAAVPFPYPVAPLIQNHHERWDGRGYPHRLAGEAIPLPGRIVAVADAFDALTHDRPYRKAWPVASALAEIERHRDQQFEGRIVDALQIVVPTLAVV
jgi:putative nucleotidyltransferase with HDIG domain